MKNKTICSLLALVLAFGLVLTGCSGGSSTNSSSMAAKSSTAEIAEVEPDYDDNIETPSMGGGGDGKDYGSQMVQEKKLVYTTNLYLETTDYQQANDQLTALITKYGGYIEFSTIGGQSLNTQGQNRNASYTLRIPSAKEDAFLKELQGLFHVRSTSQSVEDITKSYYDTQTWLESLEKRLLRLEELQAGAEDLDTLLAIEQEIAQVNYELNTTYQHIQSMDTDVSYATFLIELQEVHIYQPVATDRSFSQRVQTTFVGAWQGFGSFLQNLLLWLIAALPMLLLLSGLGILFFLWRRARRNRANRKKEAAPTVAPPPLHPALQEPIDPNINNT